MSPGTASSALVGGLPRSTFYAHYENKDALLMADSNTCWKCLFSRFNATAQGS